jgi:hypothetical protein
MSHTPGPWTISGLHERYVGRLIEDTPDGVPTFEAVCILRERTGQTEANARLIAAAPDLLSAAECVVEALQGPLPVDPANIVHLLSAAIRRATGK